MEEKEIEKLQQALIGFILTCISRQELESMISQIGQSIDELSVEKDYSSFVFKVINDAKNRNWLANLLGKLMEHIHSNGSDINNETFGLQISNLQAKVAKGTSHDVGLLLSKLPILAQQICRIEVDTTKGKSIGTGFLVGPNLVMTNYHVVEQLFDDEGQVNMGQVGKVILRFDFRTIDVNGTRTADLGSEYRLHKDKPVLAHSLYHEMDRVSTDLDKRWPTGFLDYALLQLEKNLGDELSNIQHSPNAAAKRRYWITFPESNVQLKPADSISIVHHPEGLPLKYDENPESVIGFDQGRQRVRYRTNTAKGSSGAPCFNENWMIVALHHSGDAKFKQIGYNQGIPIMLILNDIKEKGLLDKLTIGEQPPGSGLPKEITNTPIKTENKGLKVFISYAKEDEIMKKQLDNYFAPLRRTMGVDFWDTSKIKPEDNTNEVIKKNLEEAKIVLILISQNYMSNDSLYENQLMTSLQLRENARVIVVPVYLRPATIEEPTLANIAGLPRNKQPIANSNNKDNSYLEVAEGLRSLIERVKKPVT